MLLSVNKLGGISGCSWTVNRYMHVICLTITKEFLLDQICLIDFCRKLKVKTLNSVYIWKWYFFEGLKFLLGTSIILRGEMIVFNVLKIHGDKAYWQSLSEAGMNVKPYHVKNIHGDKSSLGANSNS